MSNVPKILFGAAGALGKVAQMRVTETLQGEISGVVVIALS